MKPRNAMDDKTSPFISVDPSLTSCPRIGGHHPHKCLKWNRNLIAAVLVLSVSFWVGASANAQMTGQGTISGTVSDSSRAVIVGAHVTVTNVATNVSQTTVTNTTGYFEVDNLNPGVYSISATSAGFDTLVRRGVTLQATARLDVPLVLKPGASTATITVTADASLLNTESGSQGQILTTQQIETLPVSGTNPQWLIQMAPGVQSNYSQDFSLNGTLNWNGVSTWAVYGQSQKNEYSLDGVPNMGNNRSNSINIPEEEMGEMKVDVNGFDASVGHTIGAAVTQTTKSGTNSFHGSVRESYDNTRWFAMNLFQGLTYKYEERISGCNGSHSSPKCLGIMNTYGWPGTHENNGGLGVGGPIFIPHVFDGRNKLFFFVGILDDVFNAASTGNATIPSTQEQSGDFSDMPTSASSVPQAFTSYCGTSTPWYGQYQIYDPFSVKLDSNNIPRRNPFCGNVIPSGRLTNSGMVKLYNGLLPPINQNTPYSSNDYTYSKITPQTYRDFTGRIDYAISQNDHIFARYTRADYTNFSYGFTNGNVDEQAGPRWIDVGGIGWSHIFNTKTTLAFTAGGTNFRTHCCFYPNYDKLSPSSIGLPSYTQQYAGTFSALPILAVNSYQQIGQQDNSVQLFRDVAFRGEVVRVQNRHTIRAGAEYRIQNTSMGEQGNQAGTYNFDNTYDQQNNGSDASFPKANTALSYAAFLMGVQTSNSVSLTAPYSVSSPYYAFYAGDTWRVTPKLTVMPGIRFEYEYGVHEKHNKLIVGWSPNADLSAISGPANTAYQATLAAATPSEKAVLPPSLTIQGGPMYAGVNGAPTNQWNDNYRVLPRFAAAYQVKPKTVIRAGYGMYSDTLNAIAPSLDQDGFSASTSANSSTNYGLNFAPGNSPLVSDPFPANASGARFNSPIGSAAGALYYLGSGATIYDHGVTPPRQQRGQFGIQQQIGDSTMIEINWLGALTTHIIMGKNQAFTPAQFYNGGLQPYTQPSALLSSLLPNPFALTNLSGVAGSNPAAYSRMSLNTFFTSSTISVGTLVRAYPQMSGLTLNESIGESKFEELQFVVNHRYSHGLSVMGSLELNHQADRDYFANGFDPSPSWEASNNSSPVRFTMEGLYQLPFGHGREWARSGWRSRVFGGFQLSATLEEQTGQLINFGNLFYLGNITGSNIKIKHPTYSFNSANNNNYIQWLNPGNVTATATVTTNADGTKTTSCVYSGSGFVTNPSCQPSYNLRVFPTRVKGVRQMGFNNMSANILRSFKIGEGVSLETRFEAYNVFNHQVVDAPNATVTAASFGQVTTEKDSQGNGNARFLNVSGRIRF